MPNSRVDWLTENEMTPKSPTAVMTSATAAKVASSAMLNRVDATERDR